MAKDLEQSDSVKEFSNELPTLNPGQTIEIKAGPRRSRWKINSAYGLSSPYYKLRHIDSSTDENAGRFIEVRNSREYVQYFGSDWAVHDTVIITHELLNTVCQIRSTEAGKFETVQVSLLDEPEEALTVRRDVGQRVQEVARPLTSIDKKNHLPALEAGQVIEISGANAPTFWRVKKVFPPNATQPKGAYLLKRLAKGNETLPDLSPEGPLDTSPKFFDIAQYGSAIVPHEILDRISHAYRETEDEFDEMTEFYFRVQVLDSEVSMREGGVRNLADERTADVRHVAKTSFSRFSGAREIAPAADTSIRIDSPVYLRDGGSANLANETTAPSSPVPLPEVSWAAQEGNTTRTDVAHSRDRLRRLAVGTDDLPKQAEDERIEAARKSLPKAFEDLFALLRHPRFEYEDAHRHIMVLITYREFLVGHNKEFGTLMYRIEQLIGLDQNKVVLGQMKEALESLTETPALPVRVERKTLPALVANFLRGRLQALLKLLS